MHIDHYPAANQRQIDEAHAKGWNDAIDAVLAAIAEQKAMHRGLSGGDESEPVAFTAIRYHELKVKEMRR